MAGTALAVAGVAAALGVAAAGIAYLAGAALASHEAWADLPGVRPAVAALRDLSAAAAALALGLLVPGAKLAGAVAGGAVLAATTGATKVLTGWWAAGRLRVPGPSAAIGRAGRVRAGLILVPRGELALAVGILAALAGPGRGPGTGLAALAAVEVVLTGAAARGLHLPPRSNDAGRPGWYRWTVPTPAAGRPEPPGAG
jgi:CPA2 family monovalent cation:H+ antiporter-2